MSADSIFLYGKITRRIFAIFLVFALLPVSIFSWLAIERISNATDQQVSQVLENEVKNFSYLILERLQFAEQSLRIYQAELALKSPRELAVQAASTRGELLFTLQPLDTMASPGAEGLPATQARLAAGQLLLLQEVINGRPQLSVATALYPDRLEAGLATVTLSSDYILRAESSRNLNIESCVLDAEHHILFATSGPLCREFLSATRGSLGYKGEFVFGADNGYFSRYRSLFLQQRFGVSAWKIAIIQPESEIFSASLDFRTNFLEIALGVILSLSLVSIYLIRTRMAPLSPIMAGIQRVSEKQYGQPVDVTSGDEFEELADAFNTMSSQVSRQLITMASLADIDQLILTRIKKEDLIRVVLEKTGDIIPHQALGLALLENGGSSGEMYSLASGGGADLSSSGFDLTPAQATALKQDSLWLDISEPGVAGDFKLPGQHISHLHLLPVQREDQLEALIVLGYRQRPVMDSEDIATARSFADRIAVALANAEWEDKLYHQAHYDTLTGLPNRLSLLDSLAHSIKLAQRNQQPFAVMFFDLDDFKLINDSLGHAAGDEMIAVMGQRLHDCMRADDTVARMGGDEFVVISSSFPTLQAAVSGTSRMADKMMAAVARPLDIHGRDIRTSSSLGIALYPKDGADADALLKNADAAMYHAKSLGRGNFQYFSEKLNAESIALMSLSNDIKRALEADEFELHYQPKVELPGNRIIGLEALIRWQHPQRGLIHPEKFIEVAERMGLISVIGDWTLHEACRQIVRWQQMGIEAPRVSVNLSAIQIHREDLLAKVQDLLHTYQLQPESLEIEIVEGVLVEDLAATSTKLTAVRDLGVQISIDDYGTGYSSLSYVKSFPVDTLKIDRCFITNICENSSDQAIVNSTIVLAHNLDMKVIAEGVETDQQAALLQELGCDQIQGYLFSRPVPAEKLTAMLIERVA
jgi:diguanylate cyclase (GGDEF)-like protein